MRPHSKCFFGTRPTPSAGQINTDLIDWREKAREETIGDVVPNDLDGNEAQNPKVISDDEDHGDTVRSELKHHRHCNI